MKGLEIDGSLRHHFALGIFMTDTAIFAFIFAVATPFATNGIA